MEKVSQIVNDIFSYGLGREFSGSATGMAPVAGELSQITEVSLGRPLIVYQAQARLFSLSWQDGMMRNCITLCV